MQSYDKLKKCVDLCKKQALKDGRNYVYVEEVVLSVLDTLPEPTFIEKMYSKQIKDFKFNLKVLLVKRIESEIKVNEVKTEEDILYHPDVENFLECFKMIEIVSDYDYSSDNMYYLILLTIGHGTCLSLKQAFISSGLDAEFCEMVQGHIETMKLAEAGELPDLLKNIQEDISKTVKESFFKDNPPTNLFSPNALRFVVGPDGKMRPVENNQEDFDILKEFCTDVCQLVKDKNWTKLIGREKELEEIQQILLRKDKPNIILVGEPGVGKTKLVQGFAKLITQNKCHSAFKDYKVMELNILNLIAGTTLRGQLEERLNDILGQIAKQGNVILYIDEIHMISSDHNSADKMDIASMLKPVLTTGKVKIIGSTTNDEYMASFAKDKALQRRFQNLNITEPSIDETLTIVKGIKNKYEKFHNVSYPANMLKMIIDLSDKYIKDKKFPDKAIELLDTIGARCNFKNEKNGLTNYKICDNDIYEVISDILKLPITKLSTSEQEKLKTLKEELSKEIIGQDNAIDNIINGVMISKAGLREKNKTALTLFFSGSSGCGKTATITALADKMGLPLFRYDMSEYMEEHSVSKLIGTPPGYKGYEDGRAGSGLMIKQVKENPHCIILLDEIEKAHPRVLNVFLQIMDNGKMTSSSGIEADFSNAYVFMTSNIGANQSHKMASIGFGASSESGSTNIFNEAFSPEFRNRLDGAIVFNNLSNEVLNKITNKNLLELKNVLDARKVKLTFNDSVTDYISNKAKSENLGARPIKRIIHNEIKNIISKELVYGKLVKGGKLSITAEKEGLCFNFR